MPRHTTAETPIIVAPALTANPAPLSDRVKPDSHIMTAQATTIAVIIPAPAPCADPAPFAMMPEGNLFDLAVGFRSLRGNRLKWLQWDLRCLSGAVSSGQCGEAQSGKGKSSFDVDHALSL